jgi:crotonobetainyl-CoA:carnitine CoA-transferase CaiB-like acyl-CoA transferase
VTQNTPRPPLDGIKVIDLTIWVQGPLAGQLLADLGADVIKIEKPGQGDFSRGLQTLFGASMRTPHDTSLLFELVNRNKRSIALDLHQPEGQRLLHALVREADVFVTNLLPARLRQFGAGADTLMGLNPRLVFAAGGGLGAQGALADVPAQDTTGTAYSGFMYTVSTDGNPHYPPGAIADLVSGTNLAFAVVTALLRRERTGKGEIVSTSLLQGMLWLQQLHVGALANTGEALRPFDPANAANPFLNLYRCQEGEWIALGMTAMTQGDWFAFCDLIARPDLKDDERFHRNRGRIEHAAELVDIIAAEMASRPCDYWLDAITASGLPCSPVRHIEDLVGDPDVLSEEVLTSTPSGMTFVRPPFNMAAVPSHAEDAPAFASGTFEVLTGLGLTPEQIARLQSDEIAG